MRILAFETTENIGTVAAMEDGKLLAEHDLRPDQRSAQSLVPTVKNLLQCVGWVPRDVGLVAVTIGPGSFTGLRVGLTTAKVFAYAVGAEILGLGTLEVIAAGLPQHVVTAAIAVDAQRGDVVVNTFRRDSEGCLAPEGHARLLPAQQWLASLPPATWVAGPALRKLAGPLPVQLRAVEPEYWSPRAGHLARLAARHYAAGRRDDLWTLLPIYSRPSAAEERRLG